MTFEPSLNPSSASSRAGEAGDPRGNITIHMEAEPVLEVDSDPEDISNTVFGERESRHDLLRDAFPEFGDRARSSSRSGRVMKPLRLRSRGPKRRPKGGPGEDPLGGHASTTHDPSSACSAASRTSGSLSNKPSQRHRSRMKAVENRRAADSREDPSKTTIPGAPETADITRDIEMDDVSWPSGEREVREGSVLKMGESSLH